ncbi:MAG TPA: ABC transporter ATP-binding protein [Candidatus Saccharibacteria bacterium]|nr:ABC transporter ATP-binding protein [Candidatus Saccharibacteria bacterium]
MTKNAVLALKNVSREYIQAGQKLTALQQVDFSIHPGEFIAIIGPSGSGKSTFLTIAGGLQNPSTGSVIIGGTDITKLSVKELSRVRLSEVGFILQASNLVPYLTVEKQLQLIDRVSRRKEDANVMTGLFNVLSIERLRKKYPTDLSGGERQRVAIAKVLYGTSSLILADEPTASLDTKKAFEVVELLAKETHERGKATIMVTHDERLLKYCDAVYEMRDGRLTRRRMS